LGLHHDFGNFDPLNVKKLSAVVPRTAPTLRESLRTLTSLVAAIVSKKPILSSFLQAEIFQQLVLFSDSFKKLLQVCPASISLFKQAVAESPALLSLKLEDVVFAFSEIKAALASFHSRIPCGFQLPSGWASVKSKLHSRTYYLNTVSNVLLLQLPRPSQISLSNYLCSMIAFLTIELFEASSSQCSLKSTHSSVAKCFASNQSFASSVSEAFSRIQAYQYLHHVPASAVHPVRRALQLRLVDQGNAGDITPGSIDIKFDSSQIIRKRICSDCLMFCSSLMYQAQSDQGAPAPAFVPKDADVELMDAMFDLVHAPVVHPPPQAPQHGHGVFIFPDNTRYAGEFKAGKMDGSGSLTYTDGSFYHGQFKNGFQHGQGVQVFCDGAKYEGSFTEGKRDGQGKWIYAAGGNSYTGEWKNDKRNGIGYFECVADHHYSDGTVLIAGETFTGVYKNEHRSGDGATTFFNGESLSCSWTDSKSNEHTEFQRKALARSGTSFCLSCILNNRPSPRSCSEDIGPTIAAVFARERPFFQNCIKEILQRNFRCDVFSGKLGSQSCISFAGNTRYVVNISV
jgi:hypothetical protein